MSDDAGTEQGAARTFSRAKTKARLLALQVVASALLIYAALWRFEAYDLPHAYYLWLGHIRQVGPTQAFAAPFGDYSPPYLYLLAAISPFGLSPLNTIKTVSTGAAILMALALRRLVQSAGVPKSDEAALLSLLVPSAVMNSALLGQCDGYWVGLCLFAVAAACRGRVFAMAAWAGLAFAFKAQAIFIAPFCIGVVLQHRRLEAVLIPPAIYILVMLPAWFAGWPMADLLTVYVRQHGLFEWLSTAPNLWASVGYFDQFPARWVIASAYLATAISVAVYLWRFPKALVPAALLSAMMLPWLLPKMHERYLLLADMLAFSLPWIMQRTGRIFVCIQVGSVLSIFAWITSLPALNIIASLFVGVGLISVVSLVRTSANDGLNRDDGSPPPADLRTR